MEIEEEAAGQPAVRQRKGAEAMEAGWQALGPDDLLLEGEEGEYFLELLMRKESPEMPKEDRPAGATEDRKGKAASVKGKDKKKTGRRLTRRAKQGPADKRRGRAQRVQPAIWGSRQRLTSSATRRPRAGD